MRMLDRALQIGMWGAAALTAAIMLINALYMIISPAAWFALPKWLRLQGVLTFDRYGAGWGGMQVRILGGIAFVTILWVGFRLLGSAIHE
jgi:hypothetical protein